MGFEDAITSVVRSVTEAGPKALEAINKLFPGIAERSRANAVSHEIRMAMDDMSAVFRIGEQMGMSPEMQLSFANMVFERHGSDQRVAECVMHALPLIEEDDDPYDVDDEWLDYWRVHAGKARAEDMQAMWGAVLAGEVNKPGAVSKRAMSILADMGREDAEAFREYCSKSILIATETRFKPTWSCLADSGVREDISGALFIQASSLSRLVSIGLVNTPLVALKLTLDGTDRVIVAGEKFLVKRMDDSSESQSLLTDDSLHFTLTEYGIELAAFCDIGTIDCMQNEVVTVFRAYGLELAKVPDCDVQLD